MNEPIDHLFVILDPNGVCWTVLDNTTKRNEGLSSLLADGWRPLRETPFTGMNTANAYVLILLEREHRKGTMGFNDL